MEKIGKHISELLFDHDCVIVPSLGGFLASNQPSRVLIPNHVIYPPYRRIAFNVYLKQNDGLLANHLAESENLPYTEAAQLIDSYANDCFDALEDGKKINIEEVGTLYFDKEKNIQFDAFRNFNHLKDSFGMESVNFIPVSREEKSEKKKLPPEKIIRASVPPPQPDFQKTKSGKGKRYLAFTIIASAIIWFGANFYFAGPKNYESTSLNPFDSQTTVLNETDSQINIPSDVLVNNSDSEINVSVPVETITSDEEKLITENKNIIEEAVVVHEKKIDADKIIPSERKEENIITVRTNKNYLIAGVFKIKENAQSMVLQLRQQGFSNAQIIEANNCSYVSYDGFDRINKALTLADSLRNKNLEGWIWKH